MTAKIAPEVKEKSKLTKVEWREYTKTVWSIANKVHHDHPAAQEFPQHAYADSFSVGGDIFLLKSKTWSASSPATFMN